MTELTSEEKAKLETVIERMHPGTLAYFYPCGCIRLINRPPSAKIAWIKADSCQHHNLVAQLLGNDFQKGE